ncbi:thiol peroxidase [uncultured Alistipes sp.]|uniref:thiol peroxidase n=1 Tax=uncultured Alistipes sp. TaxID=538949 RepID=UPI0028056181|nr:thiol peroxidase [uncultured Alistipes sp.]
MENQVTFGGKPVTLAGRHCEVGEMAPSFTLVDGSLQPVASSQFSGKVRIYSVFPSVDTPVCSLQNIRFNREASQLSDEVVVLSISVDLPFAQKRFCAAEGIDRVHVLSDYRDLDFGMKYGFVLEGLRLLARGVVVVDRDDRVRYVEYVPEVTHEPDYEKALAAVRELLGK